MENTSFGINPPKTSFCPQPSLGDFFLFFNHIIKKRPGQFLTAIPLVIIDNQTHSAKPGDRFEIKRTQKHRLVGPGRIFEVSFGEFDENDIERYEDDYNRN